MYGIERILVTSEFTTLYQQLHGTNLTLGNSTVELKSDGDNLQLLNGPWRGFDSPFTSIVNAHSSGQDGSNAAGKQKGEREIMVPISYKYPNAETDPTNKLNSVLGTETIAVVCMHRNNAGTETASLHRRFIFVDAIAYMPLKEMPRDTKAEWAVNQFSFQTQWPFAVGQPIRTSLTTGSGGVNINMPDGLGGRPLAEGKCMYGIRITKPATTRTFTFSFRDTKSSYHPEKYDEYEVSVTIPSSINATQVYINPCFSGVHSEQVGGSDDGKFVDIRQNGEFPSHLVHNRTYNVKTSGGVANLYVYPSFFRG